MDSSGCRIETRPQTTEEEAMKRNTDCVYYLASPLTCKKGAECEYRHSESARLNPRDCWYWLNSNCLNPKCAFRHPPLDGLFESSGRTSGTVPTPSLTATSKPVPNANTPAHSLNKQNALCIYFQKSQCLKGARCPFSHGPHSTGAAVLQPDVKPSPSLPHQLPAVSKGQFTNQQNIRQCSTIQQKISQASAEKAPVSSSKPVTRTERNVVSHTNNPFSHLSVNNKLPKSQSTHTPIINNNSWSRADRPIHPSDDHLQDGLEPGEIVEECSSGFDALRNGDAYARKLSQGGRKHEPANGYNHHSTYEKDQYVGSIDAFGRNGRSQEYHDMRARRISSERSPERPLLPERRVLQRHKSPDLSDSSDLRNRLKQRRLDCRDEPYNKDTGYMEGKRGYLSRGDQMRVLPESSLSTRLRGRINLPGASLEAVCFIEKERDISRLRGRLSPPVPVNNEGKQYERRKLSEEPPLLASSRNFGGRPMKREDSGVVNFSGPKSLAELKGVKGVGSSKDQSTKSSSNSIPHDQNNVTMSNKDPEGSPPLFEGPKPLSVLLKRKREETSIEGASSSSGNDDCQRSEEPAVCGSLCTTSVEEQASGVAEGIEENIETVASLRVKGFATAKEDEPTYDEHSPVKEDVLGPEDYMEVDEAIEEQELQHSDVRDGESDYEATETGDAKEEYEIQEEDYDDDDELDDEEAFARKVGLLFS